MANITMCLSKDCPRRTQCYRAMARQSYLQKWSNFEQDCYQNNFSSQWEIKDVTIYVDEMSNLLERCRETN